eukprot:1158899-Pelagomonas_calceolata.AAC.1
MLKDKAGLQVMTGGSGYDDRRQNESLEPKVSKQKHTHTHTTQAGRHACTHAPMLHKVRRHEARVMRGCPCVREHVQDALPIVTAGGFPKVPTLHLLGF